MEKPAALHGACRDFTIDAIAITRDTMTGRGGLSLFSRYLRGLDLAPHLERLFGSMRKSGKGRPVPEIFQQLFLWRLSLSRLPR